MNLTAKKKRSFVQILETKRKQGFLVNEQIALINSQRGFVNPMYNKMRMEIG